MTEGTKVSVNVLIIFKKRRQTGQPMTCQAHELEVSFQKPYSGICAAHAIFCHDYCLRSVYYNSLTYCYRVLMRSHERLNNMQNYVFNLYRYIPWNKHSQILFIN